MNKVIGITGGIGSGKTEVAKIIKDLGYKVLSSDAISKDIVNNDESIKKRIIKLFGEQSYQDDKLNSKYIAEKVFENDDLLDKLNGIIHPAVIEELITRIEKLSKEGEEIIFNESALIFEAGLEEGYDYIINVDAPEELKIMRIKESRNLSDVDIKNRMKKQISPERKKQLSDFTIDNSGDLNKLKESVEFTVDIIKTLPPKEFEDIE